MFREISNNTVSNTGTRTPAPLRLVQCTPCITVRCWPLCFHSFTYYPVIPHPTGEGLGYPVSQWLGHGRAQSSPQIHCTWPMPWMPLGATAFLQRYSSYLAIREAELVAHGLLILPLEGPVASDHFLEGRQENITPTSTTNTS